MPRIPNYIADCSIYLYESEEAADKGSNSGGSGFLAHRPSEIRGGYIHLYAVTNRHVIDDGFTVLRLNRKEGGTDNITTNPEDWISHPSGDDVVVFPIDLGERFKWWSVGTQAFVTHEIIETYRIGYGDEAFLVGRLVTHAGQQKNSPVIRFGNVALMAEPITYKKRQQEAFLVECRSLSGFSGSPVFVMTTQFYSGEDVNKIRAARTQELGWEREQTGEVPEELSNPQSKPVFIDGTFGPWLLGIDFGHIPMWEHVYKKDKKTETEFQVPANTGIAGVIPAWRILEVLNVPKLMKQRAREDRKLRKRLVHEESVVPDSAQERVFTRQKFELALQQASRKLPSSRSDEGKK
ncbi:MAG: hypothetical protein WA188_17815 [Terriglobales bacterium]